MSRGPRKRVAAVSRALTRNSGGSIMPEARRIQGEELQAELSKPEPCVVDFWMVGCPACARFAPTFGELAEEYQGRANLVTIEARENMETSKQYAIRGVPTVIVFRDGQEVQRTSGAKTLAEMREWLDPVLG
jgi:thioredoxin 1